MIISVLLLNEKSENACARMMQGLKRSRENFFSKQHTHKTVISFFIAKSINSCQNQLLLGKSQTVSSKKCQWANKLSQRLVISKYSMWVRFEKWYVEKIGKKPVRIEVEKSLILTLRMKHGIFPSFWNGKNSCAFGFMIHTYKKAGLMLNFSNVRNLLSMSTFGKKIAEIACRKKNRPL